MGSTVCRFYVILNFDIGIGGLVVGGCGIVYSSFGIFGRACRGFIFMGIYFRWVEGGRSISIYCVFG